MFGIKIGFNSYVCKINNLLSFMKIKNLVSLIPFLFLLNVAVVCQNVNYPTDINPIISLNIPADKWEFTKDDGLLNINPISHDEDDRLVVMIWASENPESESALDDISVEAFELVTTVLTDLEWHSETSEFENNNVVFTALDGYGFFINDDFSVDIMNTTIMLFMPDSKNVLSLVFFGTPDSYDKWENELLELIMSIKGK